MLGVYVAVWVSNQQAARDRQEQTTKVVAALRQDLRDSSAVEQKFDQALDPALAAFKAARDRGETPPPVFLRISGSDTPPGSPCLGVFQARIAELIEPALLWELCFYYDERDGTGQKFVRYAVFTENEILPRLKEDPRVFYTEDPQAPGPGLCRSHGPVAGIAQRHSKAAPMGAVPGRPAARAIDIGTILPAHCWRNDRRRRPES